MLLERIGEAHAAHDDQPIGKRRVETGIEPEILQRPAGGHGDGHAPE